MKGTSSLFVLGMKVVNALIVLLFIDETGSLPLTVGGEDYSINVTFNFL